MAKKDGNNLQYTVVCNNIKVLRTLKKMSQKPIYSALGISRQQYSNIESGYAAPSLKHLIKMTEIFGVSLDDLCLSDLSDQKNIFNTKTPENVIKLNDDINDDKNDDKRKLRKMSSIEYPIPPEDPEQMLASDAVTNVFKLRTDHLIDRQQIPIYDMEAVAGLVPLFADQYSQRVVEVMETSLIPKCDAGLRIVGDSMYPLLKSGDIVFYKQINDIINNIVWGEMYLISFDIDGDEYVSVKYIQKSELPDHIQLVSYNEHHKPMDIHISRIRALAFIKASLRVNSIK